MKKAFFLLMFCVVSALSFSETIWHFESGSKELNHKTFSTVVLTNKTGSTLEVEDVLVHNKSKATFFTDSIFISSDAYDSDDFEAIYSLKNGKLEITMVEDEGDYEKAEVVVVPVFPPPVFGHVWHMHEPRPCPPHEARPAPRPRPKPAPRPQPKPQPKPSERPRSPKK